MVAPIPEPLVLELPALPPGWQVVSYACLGDGNLAIVGTDVDLRAEWRDRTLQGQPHKVAASAGARLWTFDGSALLEGPTFPLLTPSPKVDRFPDGRWIVAGSGAFNEANVRLLGPTGEELRRIRLGDGIAHLKVDKAGKIWVGWFDQGVFGNDGWLVPELEWPPSACGVAAFDEFGNLTAHGLPGGGPAAVMDCDALNIIGETAYACTYVDFPILSVSVGGPSHAWATELTTGPGALAVRPLYVLAVGGYLEDGDRIVLLRLGEEVGTVIGQWRLPASIGLSGSLDFIDGRADTVHAVRGNTWYRCRIDDFIRAARS